MASNAALVDTNVILRHLLGDIPDHAERANRLFDDVMRGDMHVYVPSTVFFEVVYVLTQRAKVRVVDAADALIALLGLPGLDTDHPAALVEAMRLWRGQGPLSFADCFHLVLAKQLGMTRIYTFDQKMDRYPGVSRIEPS